MKLLIIGGTGNISWRLTDAAVAAGWQVSLVNRGGADRVRRSAPAGCRVIAADMRDAQAIENALGAESFDVVIDFICYNAAQAQNAIDCFHKRTAHYIFISTTAFYDRAVAKTPLTEESPIVSDNGWDYAVAKTQAEKTFIKAKEKIGFPVTFVRPGHTYDTIVPESFGDGNWTNPWRLLNGKPIIVHGDGTTLWTLTHSIDLANGIMELLKSGRAPGDIFHITADEVYTWRDITAAVCRELGVPSPHICYRTSEEIDRIAPRYGSGLKGHKMWCDIYDNSKFKSACPAWRPSVSLAGGIKMTLDYYRARPKLMEPNQTLNDLIDKICALR